MNDIDAWETTDGNIPLCSKDPLGKRKDTRQRYLQLDQVDLTRFESPEGQMEQLDSKTHKNDIYKLAYFIPDFFKGCEGSEFHNQKLKLMMIYNEIEPIVNQMRSYDPNQRPDLKNVHVWFENVFEKYKSFTYFFQTIPFLLLHIAQREILGF